MAETLMYRAGRWLGVFWVLTVVFCAMPRARTGVCVAQAGDVVWSEPLNLSSSPANSMHPAIVVDAYGYVHVFWSEAMGGEVGGASETPEAVNTIMYRRWDGRIWTEPLSVLAVRDDTLADYLAATIDGEGRLHLVWTGLTSIYYSSVFAAEADSVRAWSAPYVISFDSARSRYESDVAVDPDGNVHVAYATGGTEPGVFHSVRFGDSQSWSLPTRISYGLREHEVAFKEVRLVIDAAGRRHVVWGTANTNGYDQAVYYARSESSNLVWEAPVLLADATIDTGFTGFPSLLSYGHDELLLIYIDQAHQGRIERTSTDGGSMWTEPRSIIASMQGVNGFLIPLLDGEGGLHLVINMRPSADQRTGIYYAPRAGLDWLPIVPVAVDAPYGPSAHYTDAAVRLGNEIHVVWTQLGGGEIWHVRGLIGDLKPEPVQEMPVVVKPAPTPTEPAIEPAVADAPSGAIYDSSPPTAPAPDTSAPMVAAIVPVALLVAGVVVWQVRKR